MLIHYIIFYLHIRHMLFTVLKIKQFQTLKLALKLYSLYYIQFDIIYNKLRIKLVWFRAIFKGVDILLILTLENYQNQN